jgi:hypothetical protein
LLAAWVVTVAEGVGEVAEAVGQFVEFSWRGEKGEQ